MQSLELHISPLTTTFILEAGICGLQICGWFFDQIDQKYLPEPKPAYVWMWMCTEESQARVALAVANCWEWKLFFSPPIPPLCRQFSSMQDLCTFYPLFIWEPHTCCTSQRTGPCFGLIRWTNTNLWRIFLQCIRPTQLDSTVGRYTDKEEGLSDVRLSSSMAENLTQFLSYTF